MYLKKFKYTAESWCHYLSKFDAVTSCLVKKVEIRSERYKIISLHLKILIFHNLIKLMYTKKTYKLAWQFGWELCRYLRFCKGK